MQWKDIDGYDGKYAVSSDGRVRNSKGHELAQTFVNGYKRVNLWKGNAYKTVRVHRLVAEAFISNPEQKEQVNHKDGDKANNDVNNLEWCTRSENNMHAYKNGLNRPTYQAAVNARKRMVTVDGVLFESLTAAAKHIGVCVQTVQTAACKGHKVKGREVEYA